MIDFNCSKYLVVRSQDKKNANRFKEGLLSLHMSVWIFRAEEFEVYRRFTFMCDKEVEILN